MSLQFSVNRQTILARLDAIMHELEALRRQLEQLPSYSDEETTKPSVTEQLWGAAGKGEPNEYDLNTIYR